jgi:hypothetical protein
MLEKPTAASLQECMKHKEDYQNKTIEGRSRLKSHSDFGR